MGNKHAAIPFHRYVAIHETVIGKYDDFIECNDLVFEAVDGTGMIRLCGEIRCLGGIVVSVDKLLEILDDGEGPNAMVQTVDYSYNVSLSGVGNVFRYDSPHNDHNTDHHVHRFDIFKGDRAGTTSLHGEAGWPTLGEVIAEARAWYWENHEKVSKLVRDPDEETSPDDEA